MRLEWTERARSNRLAILAYVAQFDPDAAQKISDNLKNSAKSLLLFPRKGHKGVIQNTLELFIKPHYKLIYRIKNDTIQVLAVLDNAQDITKLRHLSKHFS